MNKCPNCSFENSDDAKFCIQCGASLEQQEGVSENKESLDQDQESSAEQASSEDEAVPEHVAEPVAGADNGEEQNPEPALEVKDEAEPKDESDSNAVADDANSPAAESEPAGDTAPKGFVNNLVNKYGTKKLGIAGGVVAVLLVAIAVVAMMGGAPSTSQIKQDIEKENLSWVSDNTYGSDEGFKIKSIEAVDKAKKPMPEGLDSLFGVKVGNTYYEVTAKVKASNGAVDCENVVSGDYYKVEGKWHCLGMSTDSSNARATQGVSKDKVSQHAKDLLAKVDGSSYGELSDLYGDAKVKVSKVDFDEKGQTSKATVEFTSDTPFSSAKATITANFAFGKSGWQLQSALADDNATKVSYEKLVGTWVGTFDETEQGHMGTHYCYGAKQAKPQLVIESVDSDTLQVKGTFSGLLHDHGSLDNDSDSTAGDRTLEATPFATTLKVGTFTSPDVVYGECEIPVDADDEMKINFKFGDGSDKNSNAATLDVKFCYQCGFDDWYLPEPQEKWEDLYTIAKAE